MDGALPEVRSSDLATAAQQLRGKLQVVIADEGYEAGRLNTVSILISNPFDVPVEVLGIQAPQSSHLGQRKIPVYDTEQKSKQEDRIDNGNQPSNSNGSFFKSFWRGITGAAKYIDFGSVVLGGVSMRFPEQKPNLLHIRADENAVVEINKNDLEGFENVDLRASGKGQINIKNDTPSNRSENKKRDDKFESVFVIEPHCEMIAYMPLKTQGWLFFKPTKIPLNYLLRYKLISATNKTAVLSQVCNTVLEIRPPLRSMIIGSALGAVLGFTARIVQQLGAAGDAAIEALTGQAVSHVIQAFGAIIMSIIATVALSRKSGTQNFITVEDFFGGFVIGVLIGYQGSAYFQSLIGHIGAGAGAGTR